MMTVLGGLNLDMAFAVTPNVAGGADAATTAGFVDILTALDPEAAPQAMSVEVPEGTMPVAFTIDAPAAATPVATSFMVETEAPEVKPVADSADDENQVAAEQPADVAFAQPFVAPPIAIGVTSAAPIVVPQGFAIQQGNGGIVVTRAPQEPVTISFLASAPSAQPALPVIEVPVQKAVDAIMAGRRPAANVSIQPLASLVEGGTTMLPAPTSAVPNAASPVTDGGDTSIEAPVVTVQLPAIAAPALSPVPSATVADAAPIIDTAPDTARQLGEQAVAARLDVANEAQMIDRLARDIAQLSSHEGRLKFQLNPEHLGALHVEVEQRAEGVSVRFGTETEGARQVIADAQHRLVSEARAQGMRITETHVDLGNSQNHQGASKGSQPQQPVIVTRGEAPDATAEARPARRGPVDRFA